MQRGITLLAIAAVLAFIGGAGAVASMIMQPLLSETQAGDPADAD